MLLRCEVDPEYGLDDLARCLILARGLSPHGYRIAFAVRKTDFDSAKAMIGEEFPIYRLPLEEDQEIERLGHLHRKHKHQILYVDLRHTTSAYLFRVRRLFKHTVVYDRGSKYFLYADTLINTAITAHHHPYQCVPEAHLLLGVKFHVGQPLPKAPLPGPASHLLIHTGNHPELLHLILNALEKLYQRLTIHVLCQPNGSLKEVIRRVREDHPEAPIHPVHRPADQRFPYERYPFILAQANHDCLDLARTGRFFATIAAERDQLATAFALEQLGICPTLGWYPTKNESDIEQFIDQFLDDEPARLGFITHALQLFDGKAMDRLAHFLPGEPAERRSLRKEEA